MSKEASSKRRRDEYDEDDDGLDAKRYLVKRSSKGDDNDSEFKQSRRGRREEGNDVDLKYPIRSNGRDKEDGGRRRPDFDEEDGVDAKENGGRSSSKRDGLSLPKDRKEVETKRSHRSERDEPEPFDRASKSFRKIGHGDAGEVSRLERRDLVDDEDRRYKEERRRREDDRRDGKDRREGKEPPYDRRRDREDRSRHDDDYDDRRAQSKAGEKKQQASSVREKEKAVAETAPLGKQAEDDKLSTVDVKLQVTAGEVQKAEAKAGKVDTTGPELLDPQEAEQQRLADEMEKRRKRVQEWQEMRRKKEADEDTMSKGKAKVEDGDGGMAAGGSKAWTLDGDSDEDDEAGGGKKRPKKGKLSSVEDVRKVLNEPETKGESSSAAAAAASTSAGTSETGQSEAGPSESAPPGGEPSPMEADGKEITGSAATQAAAAADVDADVDPLDAFMNAFVLPEVAKQQVKEEEEKRKKREEAAAAKAAKVAKAGGGAGGGAGGQKALAAAFGDENGSLVKKKQPEPSGKKKGAAGKAGGLFGSGKLEIGKKKKEVVIQEPEIMGEDFDDEIDVGDDDDDEEGEGEKGVEDEDDQQFLKRVTAVAASKADKLPAVDHSKMDYAPFRKCFYKEVKEVGRVSAEEVAAYRRENEFKLRGKDVPKPVQSWNHTGLTNRILDVIKKCGFEKPMPIQAQALPIIMSGRDCIGIAKTGSGKTLAFVLPMMRHIMDQPPLESGDGPIALVLAPTRELVHQIHSDIRRFAKPLGLASVAVYGGSGVASQINELKRGAEVVVCTPGRMIDVLGTSNGKITNMRRVTYLVLDEADRMFDMGFEPQIAKMIQNTRPDRQTVLFSATFPRSVEALARKVLTRPIEIQVGGRSVVNKDITQVVEIRPDGQERFLRLLELLGEWGEKGKVLVFVHSQDKCDSLFRDLLKSGYPCLSLHGAKDQNDRESTVADFKANVCNLLIATSVAARGLDVKELELVVNYDVPNHYEDYVHRVGRTGRAGRKGHAVTFLSLEDERFAPDLMKALQLSEQPIPDDLKALADGFMAKVKAGTEVTHGSGYGGSGFKFNEEEDEAKKLLKKAQAKEYGVIVDEEDEKEGEGDEDDIRKVDGPMGGAANIAAAVAAASAAAANQVGTPGASDAAAAALNAANPLHAAIQARMAQMGIVPSGAPALPGPSSMPAGVAAASAAAMGALAGAAAAAAAGGTSGGSVSAVAAAASAAPTPVARAAAFAAAISLQNTLAKLAPSVGGEASKEHYEAEFEVNDFPQHARWKITHKETVSQINEVSGAGVTIRGVHCAPGKLPPPGEKKLHLFIEGRTEGSVRKAKAEIKRIIEEASLVSFSQKQSGPGRYSV